MKKVLLLLTVISLSSIYAQESIENYDFNKFKKIESEGKVPEDFRLLVSEKYLIEKEKNDATSGKEKKLKDQFYKNSTYGVSQMLLNGSANFGDPVTEYVNKVADYVLHKHPELRKELRFYTIKTNVTNAFSTDPGIIFVTTGLISQLENEAQLAMVIAHEVSHYTEKHGIDSYVEKDRIEQELKNDYSKKISRYSQYSQENELEADLLGAKIYINDLEYSPSELLTSFYVLQFSNLPFDDFDFNISFFNQDSVYIPPSLLIDTTRIISTEIDPEEYENSTHPDINTRRKKITDEYSNLKDNGVYFKVYNKNQFNKVRDLCRFQNVYNNLIHRNYELALYEIFILEKKFPDNFFLNISKCKALLGYTIYVNRGERYDIQEDLDDIEGKSFTLYNFLRELNDDQLLLLTARTCYALHLKHPENQDVKKLTEIAFFEWIYNEEPEKKELYNITYLEALEKNKKALDSVENSKNIATDSSLIVSETIAIKEDTIKKELSKYDKIIQQEKENLIAKEAKAIEEIKPDNFHLYLFGNLKNKDEFRQFYETAKEQYKAYEDKNDLTYREERALRKKIRKKGHSLGIDHVLVVNPKLRRFTEKEGDQFIYSEEKLREYNDILKDNANKLGLKMDFVSLHDVDENDVDKFNAVSNFYNFINEVTDHNDNLETNFYSQEELLKNLTDAYGTTKLLFPLVYSTKQKENLKKLLWILTGVGAPFVIADMLIPDNRTAMFFILIDTETNEIQFESFKVLKRKPTKGILRLHSYDVLNQIYRSEK